jgi:tRNA A37 methylthiotransferase MiaB
MSGYFFSKPNGSWKEDIRMGKKRVYVVTNGCPENNIDLSHMQNMFIENGWTIVSRVRDADVIFLNLCGLTKEAELYSVRIFNYVNRKKRPSAEVVVCGCLPKIDPSLLRRYYDGETFGSDDVASFAKKFNFKIDVPYVKANHLIRRTNSYVDLACYPEKLFILARELWRLCRVDLLFSKALKYVLEHSEQNSKTCLYHTAPFCIKICTGCLGSCTFCAVRLSRGVLRSKPLDAILREFDTGLQQRYKEFFLIGTDAGFYGQDIGCSLVSLLQELHKRREEFIIALRNIHPRALIRMLDDLKDIFRKGRINTICAAVESGNNRILSLMNRGYTVEEFKDAVKTIKMEFPGITIRTQVMVGFPSEQEEEFQQTIALLDEIEFDFVEVYRFQARPGTKAATLSEQVPDSVSKRRYRTVMLHFMKKMKKRTQSDKQCFRSALNRKIRTILDTRISM